MTRVPKKESVTRDALSNCVSRTHRAQKVSNLVVASVHRIFHCILRVNAFVACGIFLVRKAAHFLLHIHDASGGQKVTVRNEIV